MTMSARKASIVLLLSFVTIVQTSNTTNNYSIHLNQNLQGKTLFDPYEDSPVLVFGYCHDEQCTFFRERELSGNFDSQSHLRSCSFHFDKGEVLELRAFGSNKIVFTYEARQNKRFAVVNLNGCQSYIAQINDDVKMLKARVMWTNETTFEISVNNYGHDVLCRDKTCKMSFNEKGDVVKDLHEWIEEDNYRSVAFTKDGGYIVVDGNIATRSLAVYQVNDKGDRTILTNMTSNLIPPVSTTHNYVTTCETGASFIKCVQFYESGKMISAMPTRYNVKQAKLHNLSDGGYILLTSRCPKYMVQCDEPISHFFVTKFDVDGKIVSHFTVKDFSADLYFNLNDVHMFRKDEGNELCFSSVYKRYLRSNDEQIVEIFCYKEDHVNFMV